MRIIFLTGERKTAHRFTDAAHEAGTLRLDVVYSVAQMLERMFREAYDALLSDDPAVLHPRIRRCPVLWPETTCLLSDGPFCGMRLPKELTFCFPVGSDPKQVLERIGTLPSGRGRQTDPNVLISRFLQHVGVPASLTGFDCAREAIRILLSLDSLTDAGPLNDVYEIVGTLMRFGPTVAEHAVRNAVEAAWMRADARTLENIFGYTVDAERAAPSNAAFLFRAADQIKLYQRKGYDHDDAGDARPGGQAAGFLSR